MGSCCFTPKKTHFLWWYWLGLASIVGIPMLLAARYVARRRAAGDTDLAAAGRRASRIFWWNTCVFLVLGIALGCWLASSMATIFSRETFKYGTTFYVLALEFFCCFFMTNVATRYAKGRSQFKNGLIVLGILGIWLLLSVFTWLANPLNLLLLPLMFSHGHFWVNLDSYYPFVAVLMFTVCLAMAWLWRGFLERPIPQTARRALAGFVVGAFLFFLTARYGNLCHFIFTTWRAATCPTWPPPRPI